MKVTAKIFFRSFFLQAVWNYDRMQAAGFLFSIFPRLKELYVKNRLIEACKRHLGYFNTHPYMVSFVLGFVAREEERVKNEGYAAVVSLNKAKLQMAGPLAALGDKLFWSTWRPLAGLMGVFCILSGVKPAVLIPFGVLIVYNVPVLYFRWRGLKSAFRNSDRVIAAIKKINSNIVIRLLPAAGLLILSLCLAAAFFSWGSARGILLALFTGLVIVMRSCCRVSSTFIVYIISAAAVIGSLIIR